MDLYGAVRMREYEIFPSFRRAFAHQIVYCLSSGVCCRTTFSISSPIDRLPLSPLDYFDLWHYSTTPMQMTQRGSDPIIAIVSNLWSPLLPFGESESLIGVHRWGGVVTGRIRTPFEHEADNGKVQLWLSIDIRKWCAARIGGKFKFDSWKQRFQLANCTHTQWLTIQDLWSHNWREQEYRPGDIKLAHVCLWLIFRGPCWHMPIDHNCVLFSGTLVITHW